MRTGLIPDQFVFLFEAFTRKSGRPFRRPGSKAARSTAFEDGNRAEKKLWPDWFLAQVCRIQSLDACTRPGWRVAASSPIRPRFSFCDSPEKAVGLSESGAAQPRRRVPHRPVNHKRRRSGWNCYPLPGPHSKKDVIGPESAHCASRHLNEVTSIRPARIKRAPGNVQQLPDAKGEFRQRFSTQ